MVWFQPNSTRILAFDFSNKAWALQHFKRGSSDNNYQSTTLHYLDGVFYQKDDMIKQRRAHSTIYHNIFVLNKTDNFVDFVYVFGGINEFNCLEECERYNLETDCWEELPSLVRLFLLNYLFYILQSQNKSLTSCCVFNDNSIFIFGGYDGINQKESDTIDHLNTSTLIMTTVKFKLPIPLQNIFPIQINHEEILILGGYNDQVGDSKTVYIINFKEEKQIQIENKTEIGWGMYPPYFINNQFNCFIGGEEDDPPELFCYELKENE